MSPLLLGLLFLALIGTTLFGTVSYSLRDFSRGKLQGELERLGRSRFSELLLERTAELSLLFAFFRLLSNTLVLLVLIRLLHESRYLPGYQYALTLLVASPLLLVFSIALPAAIAQHHAELTLARTAAIFGPVDWLGTPVLWVFRTFDSLLGSFSQPESQEVAEQQVTEEIMEVVEDGKREGVVDEDERSMIHAVMQFKEGTAGKVMTVRTKIEALPADCTLADALDRFEHSGLSRLPVYKSDLDHVVGILYARDLLHEFAERYDIHTGKVRAPDLLAIARPVIFVPETKPLPELLSQFRMQKIHIAIVLDEFGGTAGLVTIEDVLEELVGEISDEHEASAPAMLVKLKEHLWDADAKVAVDDLNSVVGLALPTDEGYETLGGYLSHTLGKIPARGDTAATPDGTPSATFEVTLAEPQRARRVRIRLAEGNATSSTSNADATN